jgi:ribosomal protein L37AE/L43A
MTTEMSKEKSYKSRQTVHTCPECHHTWAERIPDALHCTKCNHVWKPRVPNTTKCPNTMCGARKNQIEEISYE